MNTKVLNNQKNECYDTTVDQNSGITHLKLVVRSTAECGSSVVPFLMQKYRNVISTYEYNGRVCAVDGRGWWGAGEMVG